MKLTHALLIFTGLALSLFLVDVDITAVNLTLNAMMNSLALKLSTAQWIINGYTASAAGLMAFGGMLADKLGYKKVFLTGLVVFMLSSLMVAMSQSAWLLILGRVIQGGSIAFIFPVTIIIARNAFSPARQNLVTGALISVAGISQAIGPSIGGAIVHFASWHFLFIMNIPLGLLSLFLIATFVESQRNHANTKKAIAFSPVMLLFIGLFSLTAWLNELSFLGFLSPISLALLVLSLLTLALFIKHELKSKSPLLELKLLMNKSFGALLSIRLIVNFIYFGWLFSLSLVLQRALHYSALEAGTIMLALTLVIAMLSTPVGQLIGKLGAKSLIQLGLCIMLLANLFFGAWIFDHTPWIICLSLLIAGFSAALLIPSTAIASLHSLPMEKAGAGMGILFTSGFIGSTIAVALLGNVIALPSSLLTGFSLSVGICNVLVIVAFVLTWRLH